MQVSHPIDSLSYRRIISDVTTEFEQSIYWWYNETCCFASTYGLNHDTIPDITLLIEEHPYMQNIYDLIIASDALKAGIITNIEELTNDLYELISTNLTQKDYDQLILDVLYDIKLLMNEKRYVYVQSDFYTITLENKEIRRVHTHREFDIYNAPLVPVW